MRQDSTLDQEALAVTTAIARIFREAPACSNEMDLARMCLAVAEALTQSECGFIAEINRRTGKLDGLAVSDAGRASCGMAHPMAGLRHPPVSFEIHGLYGQVVLDGRSLLSNDPPAHVDSIGLPPGHPPLQAFLGVPLVQAGETIGVIGLGNRQGGYRQEELEALEVLAPAIVQVFIGKRAEMALCESELRYRTLVEATSAVTWSCPPSGLHVKPQPAWMAFTGQSAEEMLGAGWTKAVHPDDVAASAAQWAEAVARGEPFTTEHRIRRHDGEWRWMSVHVAPIRNAEDQVVEWIGMNLDITARKRTDEILRTSEERFRAVFEHAGIGIAIKDPQGRLIQCNPAYCALIGYEQTELEGALSAELMHQDDLAPYLAGLRRVQAQEVPFFESESRYLHKDGRSIWVHKVVSLLHDGSGQPEHLVALVTDIDARRRLEHELREADQRKDAFIATLSHELRNPLAPIRNACAILKLMGAADPAVTAARDLIDRQVTHLARLVDDLLDASRITRGKLELQRERVDLVTVLERVIECARPSIDDAGHRLSAELPTERVTLEADPVRLDQVFSNLLNNACKFTSPGGDIRLTAVQTGSEVVVEVADTGVGIPAEHLPHLFEMFHQVPTDAQRVQTGLGIGLALAKGLVEMHGGRVTAHSAGLGTGSTFKVCLPVACLTPLTPASTTDTPEPPQASGGRVLLVDDQPDILESLAMLLRLKGVEVETALDGLEALAAAERFRPDVVLLDLGMPRLDGFGACQQLRARPWASELTIVAVTGWGQQGHRERSAAAGFDAHWIKPVAPAAVLELLALQKCRILASRSPTSIR